MKLFAGTKKTIIVLGVLLIALVAGYVFAFRFLLGENDQVDTLNQQAASYVQTNAILSSLQSTFTKTDDDAKAIDSHFVPANGVVDFITEIESLGKDSGLSLTVNNVDAADIDKASSAFEERLSLRVETEGTWADTEQFIGMVENLPVGISIDGASLDALKDEEGVSAGAPTHWKGEFQLSVLKLK
ncbi:MAG TPA: hypothetical protein VHF05_00090 [Candidatus Paceibacterota bacterium]|jgi:Tfp pilus assembly protein PilO|nr:hypothetical protein [Candidatus Paceibacterota bacterium]